MARLCLLMIYVNVTRNFVSCYDMSNVHFKAVMEDGSKDTGNGDNAISRGRRKNTRYTYIQNKIVANELEKTNTRKNRRKRVSEESARHTVISISISQLKAEGTTSHNGATEQHQSQP